MQWKGLKIYFAVSGICGVLASALFHNDSFVAGCSFIYIAIYFFGCGVSSDIDDLFYKLKKEIKK